MARAPGDSVAICIAPNMETATLGTTDNMNIISACAARNFKTWMENYTNCLLWTQGQGKSAGKCICH